MKEMKVLKPQKYPPGSYKLAWECRFCEAQLEADESDMELTGDQRGGDFIRMTCPECGHFHTMDADVIPGPVKRRLTTTSALV